MQTDFISELVAEHADFARRLLEVTEAPASADCERRDRLARQLAVAIMLHLQVEEDVLLPAIRRHLDGAEMFDLACDDHEQIRWAMLDVLRSPATGGAAMHNFRAMRQAIETHCFEHEERVIYPWARAHLPLGTLQRKAAAHRRRLSAAAKLLGFKC